MSDERVFYHDKPVDLPSLPDSASFDPQDYTTDPAVCYIDDMLSPTECDDMISLFESAIDEQFKGRVYVDGVLTEDDAVKKKHGNTHHRAE